MSWTSHTKQGEAQPAQLPAEREPAPSPGAQESRRRGAVLRRLLAFADWLVLIACLFAVTAISASTEVGTLFWATLFSPVWVLVVKLHGLYDNDHRRIRHSTLDELPSLVSASVVGVLVLDGLLALSPVGPLSPASAIAVGVGTLAGSFVLRGVLRLLWHRLTAGRHRDRDRLRRRGRRRRPARRDPPGDAARPGRLPLLPGRADAPPSCRAWARSPTSPGPRASTRSSAWW